MAAVGEVIAFVTEHPGRTEREIIQAVSDKGYSPFMIRGEIYDGIRKGILVGSPRVYKGKEIGVEYTAVVKRGE